jgi:hypothetical protein
MKALLNLPLACTAVALCMYLDCWRASAAYNLTTVKGMEAFRGSTHAKELLAKNGFVVSDPAFKQIFEPYIESPQTRAPTSEDWEGECLPSFITTDSAWHTYHVLLEEGIKDLEEIQSQRLVRSLL